MASIMRRWSTISGRIDTVSLAGIGTLRRAVGGREPCARAGRRRPRTVRSGELSLVRPSGGRPVGTGD
ncbi:hypothetical protein AK37_14763 [Rhodococcus pyridinivorans AK37]|uniref:Uncharacterized protein n=1 Tax=Rhodococcus pyridinivorans AK37 TaxID=1114960 RepID=H0JTD7_9NOCA|nr:hypothetical protein AK37_14763 [Rhodococcus pyridinivorans AK37]